MTLKVVGIVGSPGTGMNTDILVTEVSEGARSKGAEIGKNLPQRLGNKALSGLRQKSCSRILFLQRWDGSRCLCNSR
jgi:hypothetical protein